MLMVAILAQAGWVSAESGTAGSGDPTDDIILKPESVPITVEGGIFYVQTGNFRVGYTDLEAAQAATLSAATANRAAERRKEFNKLKDDMGLGDLEHLALRMPRYSNVKTYRGANTDRLFSLLNDAEFSNYRHRIAWTIGAIADEPAAKKLADYLSSPASLETATDRALYTQIREHGLLGLALNLSDRPAPWLREYLIEHSDPDQWKRNFDDTEIDRGTAEHLAGVTASVISRMIGGDPLVMLQEVRERRLAKLPLQPLAADEANGLVNSGLEYVDAAIRQAKRHEEARNNPDNMR